VSVCVGLCMSECKCARVNIYSNTHTHAETLGFQFWRSGYWHEHLRGRPYHISALYVVDLHVFRRMAVGDQLRALYDTLSRDPHSLANLDQDLPNFAQDLIPIFSLPQVKCVSVLNPLTYGTVLLLV